MDTFTFNQLQISELAVFKVKCAHVADKELQPDNTMNIPGKLSIHVKNFKTDQNIPHSSTP